MKPGLFASVSLLALGVLTPASGCSISGEAFSAPNAKPTNPYGTDGGAADAEVIQGSSSSGSSGGSDAAMWGNPLCRLAQAYDDGGLYGCNPDVPATSIDCAMDGGAAAAGDGGGYACRVQPQPPQSGGMNSPTTPATGCSPSSGDAVAGQCKVSTDCAPSYDCVGATAGTTGVCRHYCCAGNGVCEALADGASLFCDVQFLKQASATPVPVCMPILTCDLQEELAQPGHACSSATQTCSVVREDGKTGCVDIGPQGPGDSCDVAHCQEGLVCLGALGQRLCYQLCDTQGSACTAPMTCQGGLPLFQDPRVGVCRQ